MSTASRTVVLAATALLALAACGQQPPAAGSASSRPTARTSPTTETSPTAETSPTTGSSMTTSPSEPGGATPTEAGPSSPSAGPSPRPSGGSLPLLPRPTAPPTAPTDVPQPVVLVGEVVEPSAPGCVEMSSGGQVFTLRLPEGVDVAVGDRLRVTGTPKPVERGTACAGTLVVATEVAPA